MADQPQIDPYSPQQAPPEAQEPGEAAYGPSGPQVETPEQDHLQEELEIEARDQLGVCLIQGAEDMAKAARAARGEGNAEHASKYAQAALSFTQAIVLVAPLEHTDPSQQTALPPKHLKPLPSSSFADQQMQQQGRTS